ncbi:transcriptional regulator, TetR family [Jatrophihabitans endophyticus]|uniref:Transcriptional regulator, TetR family n=1 Tax=Jatrophihabitans endophyticus TaxID=1206085 RepID=A0A1M5CB36_9ACTN|nr:TetR/AcrR family transcriptional regulator [Jatrophihabitans endophyticus]SHF51886.1 transcriptional regulator, TetR family [Jatrophihabitans endophyticus]
MAGSVSEAVEPCGKPMRADAVRNRELLVSTAARIFEERGPEAPLEDIAKGAGVGIGTLYRHFPTRDALLEAVYRREVETLCAGVEGLRAEHEPVEALSEWMRAFVVYVARKRGMAAALKAALGPENTLFADSHVRMREALSTLVGDAVTAGQIRDDIDPMDLMRAMSGVCMAADPSGNPSAARIIDLLLDGLRFGATAAPR